MATSPPLLGARKLDSDENVASEESPLSRLELTPFLYGHGTELTPITEQRSIATLRNGIVSTPDLESATRKANKTTLENVQESSPISSRSRLRRQQSFSLDSGKTHILQTRQRYQEALHRKETASTNGSSSSSSVAGEGRRSVIDTARVLAEIKSYPHHPPRSPLAQVVTPPEYHEWVLSHPAAARNPNHLLQRRGSSLRTGRSGHGGDLAQHPFVRGTTLFAPPTITATPPIPPPRRDKRRPHRPQESDSG
ncbi:RNA polymerase II transcription factor B subunit 1 [Apiospora marii]|uniref:RNA polymerase II transcription factor B subunit 1 n=1 Tax=Apiospora marii TaxID=335849 RepID=A0ABR1RAN9_9PEZI